MSKTVCKATKKDGKPCKAWAQDNGYCTFHEPAADLPIEPVTLEPAEVSRPLDGKPAHLKGLRRARNLRVGMRAVTMLRPICREGCQGGTEVAWDWYLTCPHDPYIGKLQKTTQVPVYSQPAADGSVMLERMEERLTWEAWPNFGEAMISMKTNSGKGVEKARSKGWIMPEDLRCPLYPNGIAPMCQFRGCRWQEGLVEYTWGTFCREAEAKLVGAHATDADGNQIYGAIPVGGGARAAHLEKVAI